MVLGYNMKLITIESQCELPELGGVMGPIKAPVEMTIPKIISLINRGLVVYDVNPKNKKEKVRLTTTNVRTDNFISNSVKAASTRKAAVVRTVETKTVSTNTIKTNEKSKSDNKVDSSKEKKSDNNTKITSPDFGK